MNATTLSSHTEVTSHPSPAVDALRRHLHKAGESLIVRLDGGKEVELPAKLLEPLRAAVDIVHNAHGVTVTPTSTILSTQKAADLHGTSRPTIATILDRGEVPFTMIPGENHRLTRLDDLVAYRQLAQQRQLEGIAKMHRIAEEEGLYAIDEMDIDYGERSSRECGKRRPNSPELKTDWVFTSGKSDPRHVRACTNHSHEHLVKTGRVATGRGKALHTTME